MSLEDWCIELCELVKKSMSCKPRIYLVGNIIALACSREDIVETFRAISEPPYIPEELRKRTAKRTPGLAIHDRTILIVDIPDFEQALVLAQRISHELRPYMPFKVSHVDLVVTYRCSEDGGLFTRYLIKIVLTKVASSEDIEKIVQIVKNLVENAVTVY